jgi:hypothetical protein
MDRGGKGKTARHVITRGCWRTNTCFDEFKNVKGEMFEVKTVWTNTLPCRTPVDVMKTSHDQVEFFVRMTQLLVCFTPSWNPCKYIIFIIKPCILGGAGEGDTLGVGRG